MNIKHPIHTRRLLNRDGHCLTLLLFLPWFAPDPVRSLAKSGLPCLGSVWRLDFLEMRCYSLNQAQWSAWILEADFMGLSPSSDTTGCLAWVLGASVSPPIKQKFPHRACIKGQDSLSMCQPEKSLSSWLKPPWHLQLNSALEPLSSCLEIPYGFHGFWPLPSLRIACV